MTRIAEHFPGQEILSAKKASDDAICISIVIPFHQTAPAERIHRAQFQKILAAVRLHLVEKYGTQTTNPLMLSLEELIKSADTGFHAEGIGLYVSQQVKQFVLFFFPVKERITVSNTFEVRDLLFQQYYSDPYYILHLTEKEARLFTGHMATVSEIQDGKFPLKHEDDYEYSPPSRGSSYVGAAFLKDYEQDKSRMKQLRYEQFLKNVDKTLSAYLNPGTKLIICGVENDIASFKRHTINNKNIAGQLKGNYTHKTQHELASSAWNVVKNFIDQQKSNLLTQLMERAGTNRVITGLPEIWKAAEEGRAFQLFVEKDYVHPGFLTTGDAVHLHLRPPATPHRVLANAIDDLMQLVLDKGGEVIIVENGLLDACQRIALTTRY